MSTTTALVRTSLAEWSRIWTVRSSWAFALLTGLVVVGLGAIIGADAQGDPSGVPADASAWDGGQLTGMFAFFGIIAMAVVAGTADHGTGGIVPTLQWTPRRGVLLAARAGVVVATTTCLGLALVAAASVVIATFLPELGLPFREGAQVLGGLGYVYATGALLAVGLGLFLRSTAGGLVSVIALVLVLPPLLGNLPYSWAVDISASLPGSNALFLIVEEGPGDDMTRTSARLTLAAWAAAALVAGGWRLLRSDANR